MTAEAPPPSRPLIDPPLTGPDRRAVRALLYLTLIAVGFVVVVFLAQLMSFFSDIVGIFFLAWLLAFLVDPIANRLMGAARWMPRAVAVLLVYGLMFTTLIVLLLGLAGAVASSISDFAGVLPQLREQLPRIVAPLQDFANAWGLERVNLTQGAVDLLDQFTASSDVWLEPIRQAAAASVTAFGTFSLIVFLSLYMAADGEHLLAAVLRLIPARFQRQMELLEDSVARSFGGFIRGQAILGVVYGAFAGLTSIVLGLPYMPLIALVVGLIHAVPFFGPFVSWLPPVLVAVLFVPDAIVPALVIMSIGMLLTMNLLQPRLMGQAVGLHPVVVLGAVLVGARIYGVLGAIFAVPVAAVIAAVLANWAGAREGVKARESAEARARAAAALAAADAPPVPARRQRVKRAVSERADAVRRRVREGNRAAS